MKKIEQSIFHSKNVNTKVFHNIVQEERGVLKEIRTWQSCCDRVQDKGSRFVVISNDEYCERVNIQIDRSFFHSAPL